MGRSTELARALLRHGLGLPGAFEDHPWGETVLKARRKVFVFLGHPGGPLRCSLKLPRSGERLLDQDFAEPTGYGLGKSGWVTLTLEGHELAEAELLALLEESYRAVAPRTLVKALSGAPDVRRSVEDGAAPSRRARRKP